MIKMSVVINEDQVEWIPHPKVKEVQRRIFLTKKVNKADMTALLVKIPQGVDIPIHIHEKEDDNLYILSGTGKMWIDGFGDFELHKGVFIRVLKGTKHKIFDVKEELTAFDIFIPPSV